MPAAAPCLLGRRPAERVRRRGESGSTSTPHPTEEAAQARRPPTSPPAAACAHPISIPQARQRRLTSSERSGAETYKRHLRIVPLCSAHVERHRRRVRGQLGPRRSCAAFPGPLQLAQRQHEEMKRGEAHCCRRERHESVDVEARSSSRSESQSQRQGGSGGGRRDGVRAARAKPSSPRRRCRSLRF